MTERWLSVVSRPSYEVSDLGRVRNAKTGRVLRPWRHKSGHLYISLGRGHRYQVHRLVLETFSGTPANPEHECRHLDGNAQNNALPNLGWGSRRENIEDLLRHSGRFAAAILSDDVAREIKSDFNGKWGDQSRIARKFGVSLSVVNRIIRGKTYAHLEH